ncbi:MAG: DNA repair protein RecN [Oscillospiraceae bacterium]|nr:DNA repair protein RecN [Oscillospiraceae bacterium]
MLTDLHIENIAVIERADVAFDAGLNVLTGETGAGKSIVIDAIGAVLGGRVNRELVRSGADHALVSAVFDGKAAAQWLAENGIEASDELILQRRITADGRSACRVNGVPATVQQLRALGALLLDMHGQNDGRQLLDETRHQDYLDRFAANRAEKAAYDAAYRQCRAVLKEIERLSMDEMEKSRRIAHLTAQTEELEQAKIQPGEEAEKTALRDRMKNAEKLTDALEAAHSALYDADENAIQRVADAERALRGLAASDGELAALSEELAQARFQLEDAAERIGDLRRSLDFSAEEYDALEERLALLRRLQRKYGTDEAGLPALLEQGRRELAELSSAGDLLEQLQRDLKKAETAVREAGAALTASRAAAGETLSARVQTELRDLGMPSVRFVTEITPKPRFDASGGDEVRFLISANTGVPPGRLSHIASGGEMSRVMLALKSVFAEQDAVETLIFDEIDTGVSGITAQRVGEKMAALARCRQLICITHLPQIAAMAHTQFTIQKSERGGGTYTTVTRLDRDGRVRELARLYGGDTVTETTLRSAAEQLDAAEAFRNQERR